MNGRAFPQNPDHLPPKEGEPALHRAARLGDHERIRRLVEQGGEVDAAILGHAVVVEDGIRVRR